MQTITRRHITAAALLIGAIFATDALVRARYRWLHAGLRRLPEASATHGAGAEITDLTMALLQPDAIRDLLYADESASVEVDITIYGRTGGPSTPAHCYTADGWSIGKQEVVVDPAGALPHEGDLIAKQLASAKANPEYRAVCAAYQGARRRAGPISPSASRPARHPGGMICC